MRKFVTLKAKTYSCFIKSVIKRKLKFQYYKSSFEATQIESNSIAHENENRAYLQISLIEAM